MTVQVSNWFTSKPDRTKILRHCLAGRRAWSSSRLGLHTPGPGKQSAQGPRKNVILFQTHIQGRGSILSCMAVEETAMVEEQPAPVGHHGPLPGSDKVRGLFDALTDL